MKNVKFNEFHCFGYFTATIINHILGEKHFDLETRIAFQDFRIPKEFKNRTNK